MEGVLQPTHLILILILVLILFGGRDLPKLERGFGRLVSNLRGEWGNFRGALFMAKGVDPSVGRDVGDMLPDEDAGRSRTWFICLLAILIGNTLYLVASRFLPAGARLDSERSPGLPALVDFWFCAFTLGVLSLAALLRKRNSPKK